MPFHSRAADGCLPRALAISLLLHGLLMLPRVPLDAGAVPAGTLSVRLRAAPSLPPPALPVVSAAPVRARPPPVPLAAPLPPPVAAERGEPAARAGAAGAGVAEQGLVGYRLALASAARRLRDELPPGLPAGRVELHVAVAASGVVGPVVVGRSSQSAALDAAGLALMTRAVASATLPAALRGYAFVVSLPLEVDAAADGDAQAGRLGQRISSQ